MKNHPQKDEPHDVIQTVKKAILLLLISISFIPIAFSQIIEYPVPKPNPNYTPTSGQVEGNLLFMTYVEDANNYYVYEFKNNTWIAKGSINTNELGYNIAASGNKVMISRSYYAADSIIKIFEYKNNNWVKTAELTPDDDFIFLNVAIDNDRIAAQLFKPNNNYGGQTFVNIYDYNGNTWVKTHQILSIYLTGDGFFERFLSLSGNHLAVSEEDARSIQMYEFTGGNWVATDYITQGPDFVGGEFVRAIDLEGNRLVVNTEKGYVLVYECNGSHWVETAQLNPAEGKAGDWYTQRYKISLSGNLVAFNITPDLLGFLPLKVVLFEYKEGHWIERFTVDGKDQDYGIDLSLYGKNLFTINNTTAHLYRIQGFPNTELTKLLASDGKQNAAFGESVDIWSNKAIIGAPFDNEKGSNAGAAYIDQHNSVSWNEIIKLTASDAAAGDQFGSSVAIAENIAVVGVPFDDDAGQNAGAVYVFELIGSNWVQKAKITASDAAANDQFGTAVAISENDIVVGAPYDNYGNFKKVGAAYLFNYGHNTWTERAKLVPNDPKNGDQFGKSVGILNYINCYDEFIPVIVVGSPYHDDKGNDSGAAYVFISKNYYTWQQHTKLTASNGKAYDRFGMAVAIDGNNINTIIVGAPLSDDAGNESGSAYIFNGKPFYPEGADRCDIAWSETAKLTASDAKALDRFGSAVAIDGKKAIVGASYADISSGTNAGAAYAYISDGENWVERKKLTGKARTGDRLGYAVAISGSRVLAGAYHDDDPVMGKDAGAAYIFDIYKISDLPSSPIMARTIVQEEQKEKVAKEETESVENPLTGIREMKIYPNPFAQRLSIELDQDQAEAVEITLMDQLGRTLYHKAFTAEENQQLLEIDLSKELSITSGLVFLGLKTPQGNSKWFRLLKQ